MIDLSALLAPDGQTPLYIQLAQALRRAIHSEDLGEGTRMPSSRGLAQDLGLSRSTVIQSYDQLAAEGYLIARRGAGMFVADISTIAPLTPAQPHARTLPPPYVPTSTLLQPGAPDPNLFPTRIWAQTVARVARNTPEALCALDDAFGDSHLRHEIAAYLNRWRGIVASPDQILITSGAREALELAIDLVIDGQDIGLESPGFAPLQRFAAARGWPIRWLRPGAHGPAVPDILPKVTVLTPSHQFPLGGTLPVAERHRFLNAAQSQDAWIIEDDFDSEFRYAGQPVPAMAGLDQTGRCLYVGTFSKTFSHAIRLGYLVLPPSLVAQMRARFIHPSAGAGVTAQRPMARFMAEGHYDRHIRRTRRQYGERYEAAVAALKQWPKEWGHFTQHRAGMQIAFHLNAAVSDLAICAAAKEDGFAILSFSRNDPFGQSQGLLIGFCRTSPQEIAVQIEQLGQHVKAAYKAAI